MSKRKSKIERRRHTRAQRVLTIEHRLFKRNGKSVDGVWQISTTENMSLVGVLFNSEIPYQVGDLIEARVVMSGALDVFRGFGRVVRVAEKKSKENPYLIAIVFVDSGSKILK